MTITLPRRIEEALNNKAAEFDQQGTDYLKSMLFAACQCKEGVRLQLDLPPPSIDNDPVQLVLPLSAEA